MTGAGAALAGGPGSQERDQQQHGQEAEGGGKVGTGFQKAGFLNVGLQG